MAFILRDVIRQDTLPLSLFAIYYAPWRVFNILPGRVRFSCDFDTENKEYAPGPHTERITHFRSFHQYFIASAIPHITRATGSV